MFSKSLFHIGLFVMLTVFWSAESRAIVMTGGTWKGEEVEFAAGWALLSVTSDTGFTELTELCWKNSVTVDEAIPELRMYIINFPESLSVIDVCEEFEKDANTSYCEPDFAIYPLTLLIR